MEPSDGSSELLWACRSFNDLLYRCWEDEYFLFHPYTGHTHVVNQFSWEILRKCAEAPHSESALYEFARSLAAEEDLESISESLEIHLDHLAQLGFLTPVESHAPR